MLLYNQNILNIDGSKVLNLAKSKVNELKTELNTIPDYKALTIAYEKDDLKEIKDFSNFINDNFKKLYVIGIGGSSLGAKTLLSLKFQDKVEILENIDSHTLEHIFNNIDFENSAFLMISKSGKTIECISQTLILMKMVEEKLGSNAIGKHFFFLTENKDSPLTQLAKEFNAKTLEHSNCIGGRFSYLSNVGLIPACIAGLNIEEIRLGAIDTMEYLFNDTDNSITEACAKQDELYNNGVIGSVVMPYIDRLKKLTEWYRQLWAESLGKNSFGILPIDAIGTIDQHSQLQLYMDGPRNLFFTFITKESDKNSLTIEKSYNNGFDYLVGKNLDDIINIEADSTVEVLNRRNLPVRTIKIKELNERCLSQLMMQYMIETIVVGKMNNINPFGQPDVEERKILAHQMLEKI